MYSGVISFLCGVVNIPVKLSGITFTGALYLCFFPLLASSLACETLVECIYGSWFNSLVWIVDMMVSLVCNFVWPLILKTPLYFDIYMSSYHPP